ncbi:PQQ-binding-like beta-propeller repeat protein [Haloterrigena salinisoli]|uniref:PQQ-like beta-propeller repeat protein n=1 Tax=Haloterrigena salinisoli TaxID=3132747 RepID=UPI0030CF3D56
MDRRSTSTRRRWLAACGGASVGITGLSGCTGSNDSDDENGTTESSGNGETADENGTGSVQTASSGGSWPMARFSASNGMATDEWSGPDGPLEEGWTVEIDDGAVSGPVVGHGFVYVADETSTLHAIDLESGDLEWSYEAELPSDTPPNPQWEPTTPAVTDDAVYFLTETFYALDPDRGEVLWTVELNSLSSGDIRVYDGIVYVHSGGKLYAIDIDEKATIWEKDTSSTQDIAIGDNGILYASQEANNGYDYEIIAADIETSEILWTYSPSENVSSGNELLVRDGTVYTHELDTVLAIDGETGEGESIVVYNEDDDESVVAGRAPTIANGIIYSAGVFDQPAVLTRELATSKEPSTWNSDMLASGPTGRRIFVSEDTLYVWRGYGYVELNAVDPETGEQRWSFDVRAHQDMARGMIQGYAVLEDSVIYCIAGNYSVIGALETV